MVPPMRRWTLLLLTSCSATDQGADSGLSGSPGTATITGVTTASTGLTSGATSETSGDGSTGDGSTGGTSGEVTVGSSSESTGVMPPTRDCSYLATDYAGAMRELMVDAGSDEQLVFSVQGLPDPALVTAATLRFVSWDADHAGEEGRIFVNGGPGFDLPADAAWENAEHATAVAVTGQTVAGDNTVAFGAGSFVDGSFYRIGQVAIDVTAVVDACPEEMDPPDKPAEAVQVDYPDATYTQRHNWVHRCDFIPPYAYTANGAHPNEDCDGLYMPDGSSKGTAIFTFKDLAPAMYAVKIQSRHSANRNPKGALFIVDGEERRVDQTTGSDVVVDEWGTKFLMGTIEVVLDSSLDSESDSVGWVRLEPL
jgi:hypothetical protein